MPKGPPSSVVMIGETHGLAVNQPRLSYETMSIGPSRPLTKPWSTIESRTQSSLIRRNGRAVLIARKPQSNADCISTAVAPASRCPQSSPLGPVMRSRKSSTDSGHSGEWGLTGRRSRLRSIRQTVLVRSTAMIRWTATLTSFCTIVIADTSLHRQGPAKRRMDPPEIAVHQVECHGCGVVLDLY
jgi:hypothetical protein